MANVDHSGSPDRSRTSSYGDMFVDATNYFGAPLVTAAQYVASLDASDYWYPAVQLGLAMSPPALAYATWRRYRNQWGYFAPMPASRLRF